jgi:glutamine amidotransferase-like uncharacterized protein
MRKRKLLVALAGLAALLLFGVWLLVRGKQSGRNYSLNRPAARAIDRSYAPTARRVQKIDASQDASPFFSPLGLYGASILHDKLQRDVLIRSFACSAFDGRPGANAIQVAVFDGETGRQAMDPDLERALSSDPRLQPCMVSAAEIRSGQLVKFHVVVVPGGSAKAKASALGPNGKRAMVEFVRQGGGYIGICAGAFLASAGRDDYLGMLGTPLVSRERLVSDRGMISISSRGGKVAIELNAAGRDILDNSSGLLDVQFAGGPVFEDRPNSDTVVLAYYRTEVCEHEFQRGTMLGTPAIVAAKFGDGRVIAFGPHPEMAPSRERLLVQAIWATSRR